MRLHGHLRWTERHDLRSTALDRQHVADVGVLYAAMVGVSLLAVGSSLRIGRVRNEFAR